MTHDPFLPLAVVMVPKQDLQVTKRWHFQTDRLLQFVELRTALGDNFEHARRQSRVLLAPCSEAVWTREMEILQSALIEVVIVLIVIK